MPSPDNSVCACATISLSIRSSPGADHQHIIGVQQKGSCLTYKTRTVTVLNFEWANVDFHGKNGWIPKIYTTIKPCRGTVPPMTTTGPTGVQLSGCPNIVTRSEWGARTPTRTFSVLPGLPKYVLIHHGVTAGCSTKAECIRKVKAYQNFHMDGDNLPDIGFSFVVGEDGNVYEGRGWNGAGGAHADGYNNVGLGISIIGNFMDHLPNQAALEAVKRLIKCGVDNRKIQNNYILRGHRDMSATTCPGDALYNLIKTWTHY